MRGGGREGGGGYFCMNDHATTTTNCNINYVTHPRRVQFEDGNAPLIEPVGTRVNVDKGDAGLDSPAAGICKFARVCMSSVREIDENMFLVDRKWGFNTSGDFPAKIPASKMKVNCVFSAYFNKETSFSSFTIQQLCNFHYNFILSLLCRVVFYWKRVLDY